MTTVTLTVDAAFAEALLARLELFPAARLRGVVDALECGEQLFTVEQDRGAATRAGQVVVRLDPTDRLLRLLPAIFAGDV